MKPVKRFLLHVLSICLVLNTNNHVVAAAESSASEMVLSSAELSAIFFSRTSPVQNSRRLFWDVQNSTEPVKKAYDVEIASDEALQAFASEGQNFRDFYLSTLNQGFAGDMFQWATDPDAAIHRQLVRYNMKIEPQDREMPETVAARKAWRESLSNQGLPADLAYDDVVDRVRENQLYDRTIQLYRRLYMVYLDETIRQMDTPPFKIDEFIKDIEGKINRAREANFRQAVQLLSAIRKHPMDFISLGNKSQKLVSIYELSKAKIKFIKNSANKGTHRLKAENWFSWIVTLVNRFATALEDSDVKEASAYYKTHFYQPSSPTHLVSLDFENDNIKLSERNYAEVLHQLLSRTKIGKAVDQIWLARYIMEASRRDVMLADALSFLKRQGRNSTLASLIKMYSQKVEQNRSVPHDRPSSLTDKVRRFNDGGVEYDSLAGIRWAGYQAHPDYWLVRDAVSRGSGGIDYTTIINEDSAGKYEEINFSEIQTRKYFIKGDKKEKSNKRYREGTDSRRSIIFAYTIAALITAAVGSVGGGAFFVAKVGELLDGKGSVNSLGMEWNATNANVSFESSQGNGQVIFDIDPLKPTASLPLYYNILGLHNLPEKMHAGFNKLGEEPKDLVNEVKLDVASKNQSDIKIVTQVPYSAMEGRVPVLTPDHYKMDSIKVSMGGVELQYSTDYKVYQVPNNGLYYFELIKSDFGDRYSYEVTFSESIPRPLPKEIGLISSSMLAEATQSLRKSGAIELPDKIDAALRDKNKISLESLGAIFAQSGVYTYDKEGWSKGDAENPFYYVTPYLKNNGIYYYQCTGSNYLLGAYLEEVYNKNQTVRNRVKVEQVSGFVLNNEQGYLTYPGHRRTLVSDTKLKNRYVILDATPIKMDPKYQDKKEYHPLNWKMKQEQTPRKKPDSQRDVFVRREEGEFKVVHSNKKPIPLPQDQKANGNKVVTEKAETLLKLKGDLKSAVLEVIRESGQTIQSSTIHKSMQDLFFLVDSLAANLLGKKSKSIVIDQLISYQSNIHQVGLGFNQSRQVNDLREEYLSTFGSEDEIILDFIESVSERFSKTLQRIEERDQQGMKSAHGYLLDEKVRWISFQLLNTLNENGVKDSFVSHNDCRNLLTQ